MEDPIIIDKKIQPVYWLQCRQVEEKPGTSTFAVGHLVDLFAHFNNIELFHEAKSILLAILTILHEIFDDPTLYLRLFTKTLGRRNVMLIACD